MIDELAEMNDELGKLRRDIEKAGQAEQRAEHDEPW